jgi:putative transposase
VVNILDHIKSLRGAPRFIRCDNGPELLSKVLDEWASENHVVFAFSRPGKSTGNTFAESFMGSLCDECLNVNWFLSIEDARNKIETRWIDYNEYRPYSSLDYKTPDAFARSRLIEAGKLTI